MKHARARNVIERCFATLKGRWAILRSPSFFPIETQNRIILACCLLHNLIRRFVPNDDDDILMSEDEEEEEEEEEEIEFITTIEPLDNWTNYRNTLAQNLFNNWRARRG